MKRQLNRQLFATALLGPVSLTWAATALADNPSWAEQQRRNAEMTREALDRQAQQQPSPQVVQYERWKQEWFQQHPNEPLPDLGELERMHHAEVINTMNNDFARMRANRQAELRQNYEMSKRHQANMNAKQNINWTPQQWAEWDREYDRQQHQKANDYVEAWRQMGESARIEKEREEQRKLLGY